MMAASKTGKEKAIATPPKSVGGTGTRTAPVAKGDVKPKKSSAESRSKRSSVNSRDGDVLAKKPVKDGDSIARKPVKDTANGNALVAKKPTKGAVGTPALAPTAVKKTKTERSPDEEARRKLEKKRKAALRKQSKTTDDKDAKKKKKKKEKAEKEKAKKDKTGKEVASTPTTEQDEAAKKAQEFIGNTVLPPAVAAAGAAEHKLGFIKPAGEILELHQVANGDLEVEIEEANNNGLPAQQFERTKRTPRPPVENFEDRPPTDTSDLSILETQLRKKEKEFFALMDSVAEYAQKINSIVVMLEAK